MQKQIEYLINIIEPFKPYQNTLKVMAREY